MIISKGLTKKCFYIKSGVNISHNFRRLPWSWRWWGLTSGGGRGLPPIVDCPVQGVYAHKNCKIAPSCNSYVNAKYIMLAFFALYPMHFIIFVVFYTLYSMYCFLCNVFYALYSIQWIICIVFYALSSIHKTCYGPTDGPTDRHCQV